MLLISYRDAPGSPLKLNQSRQWISSEKWGIEFTVCKNNEREREKKASDWNHFVLTADCGAALMRGARPSAGAGSGQWPANGPLWRLIQFSRWRHYADINGLASIISNIERRRAAHRMDITSSVFSTLNVGGGGVLNTIMYRNVHTSKPARHLSSPNFSQEMWDHGWE